MKTFLKQLIDFKRNLTLTFPTFCKYSWKHCIKALILTTSGIKFQSLNSCYYGNQFSSQTFDCCTCLPEELITCRTTVSTCRTDYLQNWLPVHTDAGSRVPEPKTFTYNVYNKFLTLPTVYYSSTLYYSIHDTMFYPWYNSCCLVHFGGHKVLNKHIWENKYNGRKQNTTLCPLNFSSWDLVLNKACNVICNQLNQFF